MAECNYLVLWSNLTTAIDQLWSRFRTALIGKQDATDNRLLTPSKEIVGAINGLYAGGAEKVISTTYSALNTLRDGGQLVAGSWYRITDYETIIDGSTCYATVGTQHYFDLLVLATSNRTLSEQALAMHSERDTQNYFANSNLAAWQIWYCLDNDTTRFYNASGNGKGYIYRMIDEFGNDCPYDFKNILFQRYCYNNSYFLDTVAIDITYIFLYHKNDIIQP